MFESLDIDKYKDCLPFVQRIINSSVHTSTGVSPAELLFGNRFNLSRGILTPFNAAPPSKAPTSRFLSELMAAQDIVHQTVRDCLEEAKVTGAGGSTPHHNIPHRVICTRRVPDRSSLTPSHKTSRSSRGHYLQRLGGGRAEHCHQEDQEH